MRSTICCAEQHPNQPQTNKPFIVRTHQQTKHTCFDAQSDVVVLIFRLAQNQQEVVQATVDLLVFGRVALDAGPG
jgi:hypothetical protein